MLEYSDPQRISTRELQSIAQEAKHFSRLPDRSVLDLVTSGYIREFPWESVLLNEGADIEEVFLILRGTVSVGLYEDVNPAMWLYVSGPGTVVDMCALLDPPVSPVTIRALSDVEALAIPRAQLVAVMEEEPTVGYHILKSVSSRLSLMNQVTMKEFAQDYPGPSRN